MQKHEGESIERMQLRLKAFCESEAGQGWLKRRQQLPVWSIKNDLENVLEENDVVVVCGDTGCGKTTQVGRNLHSRGSHSNSWFTVRACIGDEQCEKSSRHRALGKTLKLHDSLQEKFWGFQVTSP